jgi:hypothetical protein
LPATSASDKNGSKRLQTADGVGQDGTDKGAATIAAAATTPVVKVITDGTETTQIVTKAQKKLNKRLRKRFLSTYGKGMTEEEVERAKVLIARDERKQAKRAASLVEKQEETKEATSAS